MYHTPVGEVTFAGLYILAAEASGTCYVAGMCIILEDSVVVLMVVTSKFLYQVKSGELPNIPALVSSKI